MVVTTAVVLALPAPVDAAGLPPQRPAPLDPLIRIGERRQHLPGRHSPVRDDRLVPDQHHR